MYEQGIARSQFDAHLPDSFQEGLGFNIAYRTADFHDGQIGSAGSFLDALLDLIGDMGDDLYSAAQVIAAAFLLDDILVDPAGGKIIASGHAGAHEPFIMSQVQVGFCAVLGNIHFAVLKRAHGARINVDIRVKFQQGHVQPARFEYSPQGSRGNSLSQGRDHATGDKYKTRQGIKSGGKSEKEASGSSKP